MAPRQGRTYFKLDVAAILCSFLNSQGEHLMFLGISGFEDVMTIFGDNNEGSMMIKVKMATISLVTWEGTQAPASLTNVSQRCATIVKHPAPG